MNHNISNEDNDSGNVCNTGRGNINKNRRIKNEINDINVFDNTFYNTVFHNNFVDKKIEQLDENINNAVACTALVTENLNDSKMNGHRMECMMSQIQNTENNKNDTLNKNFHNTSTGTLSVIQQNFTDRSNSNKYFGRSTELSRANKNPAVTTRMM